MRLRRNELTYDWLTDTQPVESLSNVIIKCCEIVHGCDYFVFVR